jgi:hypothetical protein
VPHRPHAVTAAKAQVKSFESTPLMTSAAAGIAPSLGVCGDSHDDEPVEYSAIPYECRHLSQKLNVKSMGRLLATPTRCTTGHHASSNGKMTHGNRCRRAP